MGASPRSRSASARLFSGSVRARLTRLALLMMLPGFAISAVLIWRVFATDREGTETALRETALGLSQVLDREFAQAEVFLRTLAATEELQGGDMAAFDRLSRVTEVMGGDVMLVDRAGHSLVDTGMPPGSRPWQTVGKAVPPPGWDGERPGQFSILPMQSQPGGIAAIELVLALGDAADGKAGRHVYDLKLLVPPQSIQTVITREILPPEWIATVLDTGHLIVARTAKPGRYVGQHVRPGFAASLAQNREGFRDTTSLDGTPVLMAYTTSGRTGWGRLGGRTTRRCRTGRTAIHLAADLDGRRGHADRLAGGAAGGARHRKAHRSHGQSRPPIGRERAIPASVARAG